MREEGKPMQRLESRSGFEPLPFELPAFSSVLRMPYVTGEGVLSASGMPYPHMHTGRFLLYLIYIQEMLF